MNGIVVSDVNDIAAYYVIVCLLSLWVYGFLMPKQLMIGGFLLDTHFRPTDEDGKALSFFLLFFFL